MSKWMQGLFFGSSSDLLRTLIVGVLAYAAVVVFLRLSGNRTLSKMNAFDLIVTVALGSTLATILLSRDVSLATGCLALALLIGLQFVVTWTSVRWRWARRLATGEPTLLLYRGEMIEVGLRRQRVTPDEVLAAVRSAGLTDQADAHAVVLETDGSFSVVKEGQIHGRSSLHGVKLPQEHAQRE